MSAALQLEHLRVLRGGRTVLEVDSLVIGAGERVAVTGPVGAGKSTLLMAAAGMVRLDGGRVSLFGEPYHWGRPPGMVRLRRRLALVAQDPCLFATTVRGNLLEGLKYRGLSRAERVARCDAWIDQLGLGDLANRSAGELSGGEQRLVALGRALVLQPELLLLDEPTTHLDRAILPRIERLLGHGLAEGSTLVFATHDAGQAQRLAGRVLALEGGRIVLDAPSGSSAP
jgi:ABC-type multidrug transport system ATPase subunit